MYLKGTTLHRLDLGSGRSERLVTLPSLDVFAYGDAFVVVEDRGAGGDFAEDPAITIRDERGDLVRSLGAGFSPLVGKGGRLAYLRPTAERFCEGETCIGGVEVMVASEGAKPTRLLPSGNWGLLAWAGQDLIVADGSQPDSALVVRPGGEVGSLPVAPNEVWDAWSSAAIVVENGVEILGLTGNDRIPVGIDGALAEGTVRASDALAVELLRGKSRLVSISLEDGEVRPVPRSRGAMGPVLAFAEGAAFAFARADGLAVEAIVCEEIETCSSVLRWSEGITLLALF
jgi:hypothetical protein